MGKKNEKKISQNSDSPFVRDNNAGGGFVGDADAVGIQVSRYESEESSGASCSGGIYSTFDDVREKNFLLFFKTFFLSLFSSLEAPGGKNSSFFSFLLPFPPPPPQQVCIPLPPYATRSGPRKTIYADPAATTAAIVTCGGLCPGEFVFL